jgi:hypothetical protein
MSLPPALTWMHLLPRDAELACYGAPEWFAVRVAAQASGAGSRVRVSWGRPWDEAVRQSKDYAPLVAINCPGAREKRAREAGFAYVRRFAVMPSLQNPRWFIPLDSPAIASAAFSIYTPARVSAHLKRAGVKLAARLGVPLWFRDQILIASREAPPLEQVIERVLPGESPRIGLSAGAPEPAINRKASGVVLDARGKVLAFVKIADSDVARRIQEHEARMLPALGERAGQGLTFPKLLFAGEVDGRYLTIQTPLAGRPAPARLTPAHRLFLASLRCGITCSAAETAMVRTLSARLDALAPDHTGLAGLLDRFTPILEAMSVRSTIVHGDFAPWNLRLNHGRISAFDWEYAELDGLPLIDEAHYTLQLGYLLHNWSIDQAAQALHEFAESRPLSLEPVQVRAILAVYILDQLARLLAEGYPVGDDMVSWYRKLLLRIEAPTEQGVLV